MSPTPTPQDLFLNREWSWLAFNYRVLEEALDPTNPLLERLKFACIYSSNLDEFFMVRVAALKQKVASAKTDPDPAGFTPQEQLDGIAARVHEAVQVQYRLLQEELLPGLSRHGIDVLPLEKADPAQSAYVQQVFESEIFPTLTPVAIDPDRPFPIVANLSLNLAVLLAGQTAVQTLAVRQPEAPEEGESSAGSVPTASAAAERLAIVPVPGNLARLVSLPTRQGHAFVRLEEIIRHHLPSLFRGQGILDVAAFRLTRDAELQFDDEGGRAPFLRVVEEELRKRRTNRPVRLEIEAGAKPRLRRLLQQATGVADQDLYLIEGPLDIRPYMKLVGIGAGPGLRDEPQEPLVPPGLEEGEDLFKAIRRQDWLLHHPYDSFDPVVRLMNQAAADPDVLAIKMTLYRTSGGSPIVEALRRAAEAGKQVTVLVELMARFDEQQNIGWARTLEECGAHVIYGLAGFKTHSKITLIVRREPEGVRRYVHLGTGNYNDRTARLYTDMGLLTCDEEIGLDATGFFNTLTGYSEPPVYRKLVMAPLGLRERCIALIEREADRAAAGQPAAILAKMNSLEDPKIIRALSKASQAGVPIKLNVRGVCCLRPGVPGLSEHIEVVSIVDRYLEHSRIFYFRNGGDEEVYLSSADWMVRNLDKRVELMFPVEDPACKRKVIEALTAFFADNVRSRRLGSDGVYTRRRPQPGEEPIRCQTRLYQITARAYARQQAAAPTQFRPQTAKDL